VVGRAVWKKSAPGVDLRGELEAEGEEKLDRGKKKIRGRGASKISEQGKGGQCKVRTERPWHNQSGKKKNWLRKKRGSARGKTQKRTSEGGKRLPFQRKHVGHRGNPKIKPKGGKKENHDNAKGKLRLKNPCRPVEGNRNKANLAA